MNISLVVACTRDGVIGKEGVMPWHLPVDFAHFKKITMGKPVIMGRKTWDSLLLQPLPGRLNIILTRNPQCNIIQSSTIKIVHEISEISALFDTEQECMVIGGAEIYRLFLPIAQHIYLSQVEADIPGDVRFPEYNLAEWEQIKEEMFIADDKNPYNIRFLHLRRIE